MSATVALIGMGILVFGAIFLGWLDRKNRRWP